MAAVIPDWFTTGNGPFAVTLTPGTRDAGTGVFTPGTTVPLTGVLDDVMFGGDVIKDNIRPMSRKKANHVIVEEDSDITLVEILKYGTRSLLFAAVYTADYFKVVVTLGLDVWTFYGSRGFPVTSPKNGKSTVSVTFSQIDIGDPNPALT
jgi:hypothetical protein